MWTWENICCFSKLFIVTSNWYHCLLFLHFFCSSRFCWYFKRQIKIGTFKWMSFTPFNLRILPNLNNSGLLYTYPWWHHWERLNKNTLDSLKELKTTNPHKGHSSQKPRANHAKKWFHKRQALFNLEWVASRYPYSKMCWLKSRVAPFIAPYYGERIWSVQHQLQMAPFHSHHLVVKPKVIG